MSKTKIHRQIKTESKQMKTENTDLMLTFRTDSNIGIVTLSINYIVYNLYLDTEECKRVKQGEKPTINFF